MSELVRINMFGGLQISQGDQVVEGFVSRKVQALLAFLALSERAISRTVLMELLWGDMAESAAQASIRKALSNLRQVLSDSVVITRETVLFLHSSAEIDAVRFQQICSIDEASLEELHEAVDLYAGDLLDGFLVREATHFDEWLTSQREHLRQLMENLLYTLGLRYAAAGEANWAKSIAFMTRLLQFDPYREEAYRHLMNILARSGQRTAALSHYELCYQRLSADLGVNPMPETQALYERLKGVGMPRQQRLPPEPTPFVGRTDELTTLVATLDRPDCRLLTIIGIGGIGKTRLALQGAQALINQFWDGVWFVSLAALPQIGPADSLQPFIMALADSLGLVLHGSLAPQQQLLDYLRDKDLLLVLDNFEHILPASDLLVGMLQQAPQVKILTTSRERLNLYEEQVLEIGGLSVPAPDLAGADDIEHYAAVRLFCQHARRGQMSWQLQPDQHGAVGQICRLLEGMPLGIELAAMWVRMMSCAEIAAQVAVNQDFLTSTMRNTPERHRSLRAVFQHSWQLLTAGERAALAQIAVFRGGFSLAAAQNVCSATISELAALVDKSLVRRTSSEHYEVHELLRQFALDQLVPASLLPALQARHAAYYCAFLLQRTEQLRGGGQLAALHEIDHELQNIRLAWEWALSNNALDLIEQATEALFQFYDIRSRFQEGETRFQQALMRLQPVPGRRDQTIVLARLQARRGWFLWHLGQPAASRTALETSLRQLQALEAESETIFNLNYLGAVARHQGEYAQSRHYLEQGLAIAERSNDRWSASVALNILGQVASLQGAYDQARSLCAQSLQIKRAINDRWGMTFSLIYLGRVELALGNYAASEPLFQESLALSRRFADQRGIGFATQNLGDSAFLSRAYPQAQTLYQASLQSYQEIGVRPDMSLAWTKLGEVAVALEDWPAARSAFRSALQIAQAISSTPAQLAGLFGLIMLLAQRPPATPLAPLLHVLRDHQGAGSQRQVAALDELIEDLNLPPTDPAAAPASLESIVNTALGWLDTE
ncbi:MAG: tetratricopeptide repeat protein [Herpetosiphonaceae bacterium]|nr:tetratricopeptide repeat protein [Herpetosiphonaceae bacterium]